MYTKEHIFKQLKEMNAPQNSVVTVHSSLKSVGEVEGRGEGFLDILIEYFTAEGGLLSVPTHTWDNFFHPERITLDLNDSKTCIGKLPDLAAAHKNAHRSANPTHSMAVFGESEKAERFIKADETVKSCTAPDGCYGKIYDEGGYVLLIGVGLNKNTYLHCVEEMLNVNNRMMQDYTPVTVKTRNGEIINKEIRFVRAEGIPDVSANFPKLEPAFNHYGAITYGKVGDASAMLCDAVKMKDVMEIILKRSGGKELLADLSPLDEKLYI